MSLSTRDRIATGLFALAVALTVMLALTRAVPFPARAFLYDYRAFACAGAIVANLMFDLPAVTLSTQPALRRSRCA